jgi:hypothetical protein
MSKEDQELLRAVREWRPPETLHPIAGEAWKIYERAGLKLTPEAMAELKAALDVYADDLLKLAEACEGMTRFMVMLNEHRKEPQNGEKVLGLLRGYAERFEPFWRRVAEALEREGGTKLEAFQRFSGGARDKKEVAMVGQAPPPGAVPLSSMLNPARPPPWAKKKGPGAK